MATSGAPGHSLVVPRPGANSADAMNWVVLAAIVVGVGLFLAARAHQQAHAAGRSRGVAGRSFRKHLPDTLELAPQTVRGDARAGRRTSGRPRRTAPLKLYGSLYLEGSRLVHVQTRFTGQVVEVGEITDENDQHAAAASRATRSNKGEVLAKLWSKEVGEKKSDLVDAISKLYLHENVLEASAVALQGGVVAAGPPARGRARLCGGQDRDRAR